MGAVQTVFDYILIETTGLADPGPVAAALWTDVEIEAGVLAKYCFAMKQGLFQSGEELHAVPVCS